MHRELIPLVLFLHPATCRFARLYIGAAWISTLLDLQIKHALDWLKAAGAEFTGPRAVLPVLGGGLPNYTIPLITRPPSAPVSLRSSPL